MKTYTGENWKPIRNQCGELMSAEDVSKLLDDIATRCDFTAKDIKFLKSMGIVLPEKE